VRKRSIPFQRCGGRRGLAIGGRRIGSTTRASGLISLRADRDQCSGGFVDRALRRVWGVWRQASARRELCVRPVPDVGSNRRGIQCVRESGWRASLATRGRRWSSATTPFGSRRRRARHSPGSRCGCDGVRAPDRGGARRAIASAPPGFVGQPAAQWHMPGIGCLARPGGRWWLATRCRSDDTATTACAWSRRQLVWIDVLVLVRVELRN
jgi:hypothetical protein